jgi:hypothetical protein
MPATMDKPRTVTQYDFRGVNADGMACYDEIAVEATWLADRPVPYDADELQDLTREERREVLGRLPLCLLCSERFDPRECCEYTESFCCTCAVNRILELALEIRDGATKRDRDNAVRLLRGFGQLPPRQEVRKLLAVGKRSLAAVS